MEYVGFEAQVTSMTHNFFFSERPYSPGHGISYGTMVPNQCCLWTATPQCLQNLNSSTPAAASASQLLQPLQLLILAGPSTPY